MHDERNEPLEGTQEEYEAPSVEDLDTTEGVAVSAPGTAITVTG